MESADLTETLEVLTREIGALSLSHQELRTQVRTLQGAPRPYSLSSLAMPPFPQEDMNAPEPNIPLPDRYDGNRTHFREFITGCQLFFSLKPRTYNNGPIKVHTIITLLTGDARVWAHNLLYAQDPALNTWETFVAAMDAMFGDPFRMTSAQNAIRTLKQGRHPVEEYITAFKSHALDTTWNEPALIDQFRRGLSEHIKDELARGALPPTLEDLTHLTIAIDRRWRERQQEKGATSGPTPSFQSKRQASPTPPRLFTPPAPLPTTEEPMQIGLVRGHLPPEELARRRRNQLCLYCGGAGHHARLCPEKTKTRGGKTTILFTNICSLSKPSNHLFSIPVTLQWNETTITLPAMIDSGASNCFFDVSFAQRLCIPTCNKEHPVSILLVDGSPLKSGVVDKETTPLQMMVGSAHKERVTFDLIQTPLSPIILGLPWLRLHNPAINWSTGTVSFFSEFCKKGCLSPSDPLSLCTILDHGTQRTFVHLPQVYHDHQEIFNERGVESLPPHREYDCPIDLLPGCAIPFGRIYPLSEPELTVLKTYIDENLTKGFIRPSTSPAGAGIFFIGKKDGGLRPCVDYRDLNRITIKNRYPLPLIPELLERLQTAKIFSKLDLRGAYNLVRIRKGDEWKTAFRTRYGHFEYKVMPYGLCNAPATFQHLVNDIFRDLLDRYVVVYLDDILIYSTSLEEHRAHMHEVLNRLRTHNLYVKLDKCVFETQKIPFLGFILSPGKVEMDPLKITAITSWPTPANKIEVQRFLGFANFYRKFIRDFSKQVQPLTALTKKNNEFTWTPETQTAFKRLQHLFISAPILELPDLTKPFFLEVDASDKATGAILSQRNDSDDKLHPVAFHSKRLSVAEINYDVGDKELLAIKRALEEWRHLLEGTLHPITVYTDHRNLEYLQTARRLNSRQARWSLFFTRFFFHITYRPGDKNGKADALSRQFSEPDLSNSSQTTILKKEHFLHTCSEVLDKMRKDPNQKTHTQYLDGLPTAHDRIYVSPQNRLEILQTVHDSLSAGHPGINKTIKLANRYFWWPSINTEIKQYVQSCQVCSQAKHSTLRPAGLLQPLVTPDTPWKAITVDFIVDLPPSHGNTTIMVVVDRHTKMAHFVPVSSLPTAEKTADLFYHHIFRLHGVPSSIISDRGTQFTSKLWSAFCKILKIKICLSSAFHPQSNGQTERVNQWLEQYLRCFTTYLQDDWHTLLPSAEFSYNSQFHDSIKNTPFFVNFGYHPSLLPDLPSMGSVPSVNDRILRLQDCHRRLQTIIKETQRTQKIQADRRRRPPPSYQVGQKVWLSTRHLRLSCPTKKLGPKYIGPFTIVIVYSPVHVRLELPPSMKVHPVFHVSLIKPHVADTLFRRPLAPPGPLLVDGEEEYEVEDVLDSRYRRHRLEYLIQWKGYGPEERSWEPASVVHARPLVQNFHRAHPEKPAPLRLRGLRLEGG
uniref:Gypsy retrotransposon integrase-like protein 1 n=1 Tax=Leptobrachium leishanense TaxID=445787 RepID=A0A8C5M348_9ANUR